MSGDRAQLSRGVRIAVAAMVLGLLVGLAYVFGFGTKAAPAPTLQVYGELPDFALRDQRDAAVTRGDLAGKTLIVNFIFTRCPTICPTFSMKMQRVAERLKDEDSIHLLSISVDPSYDTPPVLAEFASHFSANPRQWSFLTGDEALIRDTLTSGLAIALEQRGTLPGGAPDIVHGTHFVLIDGQHQIRGYYNSDTQERIDELVRDARALAR